jgi:predicted permease
VDSWILDLRHALRRLRRSPGFTVVAVTIIALGIGVNTAIFGLVEAILFRPLPYEDLSRVVRVYTNRAASDIPEAVSYLDYTDYRQRKDLFSGSAVHSDVEIVGLDLGDGPRPVTAEFFSANFFTLLGVEPQLGRGFAAEEDVPGLAEPPVILSHATWKRRFGSDPAVLGRTFRVNGHPVTVVGVGPPDFAGTTAGFPSEIWLPLGAAATVEPSLHAFLADRGARELFMIARLRPGVTVAGAGAGLDALAEALGREYPDSNEDRTVTVLLASEVRFHPAFDAALYPAAAFVMGVVVLVLLVGCSNLANLLLVRSTARQQEIAVRRALGADRRRLIRPLLAESVVLGTVGGLLGLLVAWWTMSALLAFQPKLPVTVTLDLALDWRVLAFTALLSLITGVLFGLVPAIRGSRPAVSGGGLRVEGGGGDQGSRLRSFLVAAQVAVSVVLLVGAGLFLRAAAEAQRIDPGFEREQAAVATIDLGPAGHLDEAAGRALLERFRERVAAAPGVTSVALASHVPLGMVGLARVPVTVPEDPAEAGERPPEVEFAAVSREYFGTLGVPIVRGRAFTAADGPDAARVAVVSQQMAARWWGEDGALGRTFFVGQGGERVAVTIVGVAADTKVRRLGEPPRPYLYLPLSQRWTPQVSVIARTAGTPSALPEVFRRELRELDPDVLLWEAKTMSEHLGFQLFLSRWTAALLALCSLAALALASFGLYGVVAFKVARRRREIGVRMALGAEPGRVVREVLRQGLTPVVAGLAMGLVVAIPLARLLAGWWGGVSASDPLALLGAPLLLMASAVLAGYVPARRAARVDPMASLRE